VEKVIRRARDRVALYCLTVPVVVLLSVRGINFVDAQSRSAVISVEQATINATMIERASSLDRRVEHLEKMSEGTFLALIGVLVSQIISLRRRPQHRARVTED